MKTYKRCSQCKITKPVADFYKDKRVKDGFMSECKACNRKYAARPENREKFNKIRREKNAANRPSVEAKLERDKAARLEARKNLKEKKCRDCEIIKSIGEFRWVKNGSTENWTSRCRDCEASYGFMVRQKPNRKEYISNYYKNHPEKRKTQRHRRRAKQNDLPNSFTESDWNFMMEYWNYTCCICGATESDSLKIAGDHWIPIASPECIGTVPQNMLPMCHGEGGCNGRKQDKDGCKWLVKRYGEEFAVSKIEEIKRYFALVRVVEVFLPIHEFKECAACLKTKSIKDFRRSHRSDDFRVSICKECSSDKNVYAKTYRRLRPDIQAGIQKRASLKNLRVHHNLQEDQMFYCDICQENRPYYEFRLRGGKPTSHKTNCKK